MKDKFVLIDASAIIHRAFHALPPLSTKDGQLVNAVYGFSSILLKILNDIKPKYIAVAFDSKEKTFRHKEYKEYKAKRIKKGPELYSQYPYIRQVLEAFSIPIYEAKGYEADDVIATIAAKLKNKKGIEAIVVTGDLDTLQLVDKDTEVYAMRKGLSDIIIYDENKVRQRFGFSSKFMNDYKALAGDASDNIPGVSGIGEKVASRLISQYGDLNNVYKNLTKEPEKIRQKLEKGQKAAGLSKKLSVLCQKTPIHFNINDTITESYDQNKAAKLFTEFDFKSLIKRLPGYTKNANQTLNFETENKKPKSKSEEIDNKVQAVLRETENTGVLIDVPYLLKLSKKVEKEIAKLKQEIYQKTGGGFNIDSPIQLSQILFTRLTLPILGLKKTKTGISTAASELSKLQHAHPVIDKILKYRELAKLKNTYLDTLPKMVDAKSRLHTTYAPDTQTGRLSSKNPNLQNIPIRTELGNEIRKAFISAPGFVLLSADYSQIELRIIAHLSGEPKLIKAFLQGADIHSVVSKALSVSRRVAKIINFGVIYGMSAHGLSQTLNIPREEAQNYIDKFFVEYPVLSKFIAACIEKARTGSLETIFGRKRDFMEINSPIFGIRTQAERMAINYPCQGSGADIIKLAMVKVNPEIKKLGAKLILTVHDELVFETPKNKLRAAQKIIKEIMEKVVKLKVPLIIKISIGKNWGQMKGLA